MTDVERTFTVGRPMDAVVGYLRDFAHAQEWDPGTKSCHQESTGPVAAGTVWRNVSEFRGRRTTLSYTLVTDESDHLVFRGENSTVTSTDDLRFTAAGGATEITYHAHLDWHGWAVLAGPFVAKAFEELGDATLRQLTIVLNDL